MVSRSAILSFALLLCAPVGAQSSEPVSVQTPSETHGADEALWALDRCAVLAEGAKLEGDPKRRLAAFAEAIEAYQSFLDSSSAPPLRARAASSYLALVNTYGHALELALAGASDDEARDLRQTIARVLDEALARTSALAEAATLPDATTAEGQARWRPALDRAQLLITRGGVAPDPEPYLRAAQQELERVLRAAGESSGPGLNARLSLAKLARARGEFGAAVRHAEHVVSLSVPANPALPEWTALDLAARSERFRLVELALPDLLASLTAQGQHAEACARALFFTNTWQREGFTLSPLGTLARLAAARALLAAGGFVVGAPVAANLRWFSNTAELAQRGFSDHEAESTAQFALATAQEVEAANRGNTLRLEARRLLSDVLGQPGVALAPAVRLEAALQAALAEYDAGNFEAARSALEQLLRELDGHGEATQRATRQRVLFHLGESYSQLGRAHEAATAFRAAATTWADDEEYRARAAQGLYREVVALRRATPGDADLEELFLLSERLLGESEPAALAAGVGAGIHWRAGERAYARKDYAAARKSYLALAAADDEHEKAVVQAALCLYRTGDASGAKRELQAYLASLATAPEDVASSARKRAARAEARAQATYFLGKLAAEAGAHDEVLAVLAGYASEFPAQLEYAPNALYLVLQAQLAKADLVAARASVAALELAYPTQRLTGRAAFSLYTALARERAAAEHAGDAARAHALKREMARCLASSNRLAGEASFANLRIESGLWLELGELAQAERSLRATLAAFEQVPERALDLQLTVRPELGRVLLAQQRVAEAFAVLDALVPQDGSEARKPSSAVVRDWCRAVTGWLEEEREGASEGAAYREVPGVGGDFERVSAFRAQMIEAETAASGAWSCAWYGLQFERAYDLWQWSRSAPGRRDDARRLLEEIALYLDDPELGDVAKKCGDELLRKRFVWLRNQLR